MAASAQDILRRFGPGITTSEWPEFLGALIGLLHQQETTIAELTARKSELDSEKLIGGKALQPE
jgi:hypothetical protein